MTNEVTQVILKRAAKKQPIYMAAAEVGLPNVVVASQKTALL